MPLPPTARHFADADPAPASHERLRIVLQLQAALLAHPRLAAAATALATDLAQTLGCTRVTVGRWQSGQARPLAVSHGRGARPAGEPFDRIAAAMDEAIDQGGPVCCPAADEPAATIRLAHLRLQQAHGGAVATLPLAADGRLVGAVTCEWAAVPEDFAALVRAAASWLGLAGPVIELLARADASWRERVAAALRAGLARLRSPDGRRLRFGLAALLLPLALLVALPVPTRVGGRVRIEGEQQRTLVAPVAGFLGSVSARPGDRVRAGDVLAELADQDLQLAQRKAVAELAQQDHAAAAALAQADRSALMVAVAKADQARAQLALIEAELARARLVAPFDGVVLQGDLAQAVGAPVERGQPLLVVAPAERYRALVEVDETDIAAVARGQSGTVALAALPWQALALRVRRIDPIARAADGRNVFAVEVELPGAQQGLRPGLEGVAKIEVGRAPAALTACRRLADWLRASFWLRLA